MNRFVTLFFVLAALALGGGAYLWRPEIVAASYRTEPLTRGDIRYAVTSAGRVHAQLSTEVSSQLSGQIAELHADFNDRVKQGECAADVPVWDFEWQRLYFYEQPLEVPLEQAFHIDLGFPLQWT